MALKINIEGAEKTLFKQVEKISEPSVPAGNSKSGLKISTKEEGAVTDNIPQEKKERIKTMLRLSDAAGSVNKKEALTEEQRNTVDKLINISKEIKREVDPVRREQLEDEASDVLDQANSDYNNALSRDSTLAQGETVVEIVSPEKKAGYSEKYYESTIPAVRSLSSYGLSASTSFSQSSIDSTITTLENTRDSLNSGMASYSSARSDLTQEVKKQAAEAGLIENNNRKESMEQLANKLAEEIRSSTEEVVQSSQPEQISIKTLLQEDVDEPDQSMTQNNNIKIIS